MVVGGDVSLELALELAPRLRIVEEEGLADVEGLSVGPEGRSPPSTAPR